MVGAGIREDEPFLALHLSGGTTEVLLCKERRITLIGGTLDLHAGQLVDRIGVQLGLSFPAGPALEALALQATAQGRIGVSIKGTSCNLSGAQNKASRWIERQELTPEQVAAEIYDYLCRTFLRLIEAACGQTGCRQALLAGGVASSVLLRRMLLRRAEKEPACLPPLFCPAPSYLATMPWGWPCLAHRRWHGICAGLKPKVNDKSQLWLKQDTQRRGKTCRQSSSTAAP